MTFRKALVFVACLIGIVPAVSSVVGLVAAPGPIWIHATFKTGFAPQKVLVDVHIVPEDDDRAIWLDVYEGGLLATTSEIQLSEGAQSRRTHHWVFSAMWPGEYTIIARVGHGETARAVTTARLVIP